LRAEDLSGKTYQVKGSSDLDDSLKLVVMDPKTTKVDLSGLTFTTDTTALSALIIDGSSSPAKLATVGSAISDSILGGTVDDSITAGEGSDSIKGGAGNDTILLTEVTALADTVIFDSALVNGQDSITGFSAGSGVDMISLVGADTNLGTRGVTMGVFGTLSSPLTTASSTVYTLGADVISGVTSSNSDLLELQVTLSAYGDLSKKAIDGSELLKALSFSKTTAATDIALANAGDRVYVMAYQKGNAYLYYLNDADASGTAVVSEIALVGTFKGVGFGDFANGDVWVY
jgi:hypothetical protein